MNRTLVVSSSAAGAQLVQELLPARDYSPVIVAGEGLRRGASAPKAILTLSSSTPPFPTSSDMTSR